MAESPFPRLQAAATILTPVLLGIGGLLLSNQGRENAEQLQEIAQTVSAVEAMQPYIDLLADGDSRKAKMAAYALYKLNPRDKKGAIYIILAADRVESNDVLSTLADDDPEVRDILERVITDAEQAQRARVEQTEAQPASAGDAPGVPDVAQGPDVREIPIDLDSRPAITQTALRIWRPYQQRTGWMYVGTFKDGWGERPQISVSGTLPEKNRIYTVVDDTYLRETPPGPPLYRLDKVVGVVKMGDQVRIDQVEADIGRNRVWANVRVEHAAD